jgi:putative endonuclease
VRLIWCLPFDRIDEAWALEKQIQGWSRAKRIALIEGRFDYLSWLSSRGHAARRRRTSSKETNDPPSAG